MCDFKPGDEVVCVDVEPNHPAYRRNPLVLGKRYTVSSIGVVTCPRDGPVVVVMLDGVPQSRTGNGWGVRRFRKVQRRNLTEWLSQKTKFEEPKRIGENV